MVKEGQKVDLSFNYWSTESNSFKSDHIIGTVQKVEGELVEIQTVDGRKVIINKNILED